MTQPSHRRVRELSDYVTSVRFSHNALHALKSTKATYKEILGTPPSLTLMLERALVMLDQDLIRRLRVMSKAEVATWERLSLNID